MQSDKTTTFSVGRKQKTIDKRLIVGFEKNNRPNMKHFLELVKILSKVNRLI